MSEFLSKLTKYDDLTVVLAVGVAVLYLVGKWATPVSLVHPILLGRQSDVARVRKAGESAVYRNFGTGSMGMLPPRPAHGLNLVGDLLKKDFIDARMLWSCKITNADLERRSRAIANGFIQLAALTPKESNVLLLLTDGIEFLLSDLALIKCNIPSLTLSSLRYLAPVLEHHPPSAIITHASLVPQLLEHITETHEATHHTLIIVGEDAQAKQLLRSQKGLKVVMWDEVEATGDFASTEAPANAAPSDVVTVAFHDVYNGQPIGVQLTHENIIAGVTATRVLMPLNELLTPSDTIYSAYSLSTPFGRAIAYTALYEGANFSTMGSTSLIPAYNLPIPRDVSDIRSVMNTGKVPPSTVMFGNASHVEAMTTEILDNAKSTIVFQLAWLHKLSHLVNGFSTKKSFWDTWYLSSSRALVLGKAASSLREVVVCDSILNAAVPPAQVALSIPIVKVFTHPLVCGPVFASHPMDLQTFPDVPGEPTSGHVGPPTANVEIKLEDVDDAAIESGGKPSGAVLARGPSIGKRVPTEEGEEESQDQEKWTRLGYRAVIATNGGIKTPKDLLLPNPSDLAKKLKLSLDDVVAIIDAVCCELEPKPRPLKELDYLQERITTGDTMMDGALNGGIRPGLLWELCGESSAGKTQLALQLSLMVQLPVELGGLLGGCCYLSTRTRLQTGRLSEMIEKNELLSQSQVGLTNIHTMHITEVDVLSKNIASGLRPVRLIVLDSIMALFRSKDKTTTQSLVSRSKSLSEIATRLRALAVKRRIAVIIVNEVTDVFVKSPPPPSNSPQPRKLNLYQDQSKFFARAHTIPGEDKKEATLGLVWTNQLNARIMMTRTARRRFLESVEGDRTVKRRKISHSAAVATYESVHSDLENTILLRRMSVIFCATCHPVSMDFIIDGGGVSIVGVDDSWFISSADASNTQPSTSATTPIPPRPSVDNEEELWKEFDDIDEEEASQALTQSVIDARLNTIENEAANHEGEDVHDATASPVPLDQPLIVKPSPESAERGEKLGRNSSEEDLWNEMVDLSQFLTADQLGDDPTVEHRTENVHNTCSQSI